MKRTKKSRPTGPSLKSGIRHRLGRLSVWILALLGSIFLFFIILSFTDIPYNAYHRLGTSGSNFSGSPESIVILSASGMPSPDGLMRLWQGADAARRFPYARIILAHPFTPGDSLKALNMMAKELTLRGIEESRIQFAPEGFNTHSQAAGIAARFPSGSDTALLLVITSPEHLYRSVRTFRKAGFSRVGGIGAFDKPIDPEQATGGNSDSGSGVRNLDLRYNVWSYLNYELIVAREYLAIAYYRLKGWI